MEKTQFTENQIIAMLKQHEQGMKAVGNDWRLGIGRD